jgi:hypothetical protein
MPTLPNTSETVFPVHRDTTVIRNFRTGSPDKFRIHLNTDLGLRLSEADYGQILDYFKNTAHRDPTVGELRLLDGLKNATRENPAHIAVGELITTSAAMAQTWADMMRRHGALHGAEEAHKSGKTATPPCTLTDALNLSGKYVRNTSASPRNDSVLMLSSPRQEAMAAAAGYIPTARMRVGQEIRAVWEHRHISAAGDPPRTGDLLLHLARIPLPKMHVLMEREAALSRPLIADIRAVAEKPFLLTLTELCPAMDLYASRLVEADAPNGYLPLALLCNQPTVSEDGVCDYLLRVSVHRIQAVNQLFKELNLTATVCGQVRTGGNLAVLLRNKETGQDAPAVTLPLELLQAFCAAELNSMHPHAIKAPAPAPIFPVLTRLPSITPAEDGMTPDGREAVALTRHESRILRIPQANLLLTALAVEFSEPGTAYTAAANAVETAARQLAELHVLPERIRLSVTLRVPVSEWMNDGTALAAICGVDCAASQLLLSVEDSLLILDEQSPFGITVIAWAQDAEISEKTAFLRDSQWHNPRHPVHKESPAYMLPVLRRSYEDSLKAISAALNHNQGAACAIRPLAMVPVTNENLSEASAHAETEKTAASAETRYTLHPDSLEKLLEELNKVVIPVFSLNETDTRLLLGNPAVFKALCRRLENGWSILVLGESCKVFAEYGFLTAELLTTPAVPVEGHLATVTYSFPADPSVRALRGDLLAPAIQTATGAHHLLTLHLPDGTRIHDGFVGGNGHILALLNGLDTATLPLVQRDPFTL